MRLCSGSLIKHIVFNIVLDKTLGNELFPLSIPIILKTGTDWPAVRARLCFCSLTDMKYQVKNVSGIFWVNWLSRFKITRFCPSMEQSKLNQLLSNSLSVSSVVLVQFLGQLFYKNHIISTVLDLLHLKKDTIQLRNNSPFTCREGASKEIST